MDKSFLILISKLKRSKIISAQQYKTIRGQFYSGDTEGAEKGLHKIVKKYYRGKELVAK